MKRVLTGIVLIAVASTLLLAGCNQVSPGPSDTREFILEGFTGLQVGSAFQVEVVKSDDYKISVTAPRRMFDYLKVEADGETLKLRVESGWVGWFPWVGSRPRATVSMPALKVLDVSGASRVTATGFESSNDFKSVVSGASSVEFDIEAGAARVNVSGASRLIGRLEANSIAMDVTGASRVGLSGSGDSLQVGASGASNAELDGLNVGYAKVTLSGASRAAVAPRNEMTVALSGASTLTYTGSPSLKTVEVSGASKLLKR